MKTNPSIAGAASIWITPSSRDCARLVRNNPPEKPKLTFPQALFLKNTEGEPIAVPPPSPKAGLYIRTRGGELTKVSIPVDCLAFQTGEALEIATGGKLLATPHCVRVVPSADALNVSRETFALFMQPNTDQQLSPSMTFGQFSRKVFDEHYQ